MTTRKNKTKKMKKNEKNETLEKSQAGVHKFTPEEYSSNDGMLTTIWGPGTWHFLHTMSFNYPIHPTEIEKTHYMYFVRSLQNVLPCGKCRKNLKKNFEKLPLNKSNMKSRETFSKYIYDLHETVNTMLKKKSNLTYEEVRERYEHFRARCMKSMKTLKKKCNKKISEHQKKGQINKKGQIDKKGHSGCTVPLYGEKSKCVLHIVPQKQKCETFQVDDQCMKKDLGII
jgi:hypothetical protein